MQLVNNSSRFASISDSIFHYRTNKTNIDSVCDYYKVNKKDCILYFSNYDFLRKYENVLRKKCKTYDIEEKYYYKPEYVSNILYESPDLWYLILFLNGLSNNNEFNKPSILAIPPEDISLLFEIYANEKNVIHTKENPEEITGDFLVKSLNTRSKKIIPQKI